MRAEPPILLMFEPRRAGVCAGSGTGGNRCPSGIRGHADAGGDTRRASPRWRQKRSASPIAGSLTECRPVSTRPATRREKLASLSAVTMKSYQ